jgi:anti-sigma factor RsiW
MDRLADVHRVRAHLDGQHDLADHVARVRADDGAAKSRPREQALLDLDPLRLRLVLGQPDPRQFLVALQRAGDDFRRAVRMSNSYPHLGIVVR